MLHKEMLASVKFEIRALMGFDAAQNASFVPTLVGLLYPWRWDR